jgi:hypothetical protein
MILGDTVTCRFSFPQYPMPFTQFLEPLEESEFSEDYNEMHKNLSIALTILDK